jgi:hypothetical protein
MTGTETATSPVTPAEIPAFSFAERDRRWNLAKRFMDVHGFDNLLVMGEHEDAGPAPFIFETWFTNDRPGAIGCLPPGW